jgi:uncharacterized membrane protein
VAELFGLALVCRAYVWGAGYHRRDHRRVRSATRALRPSLPEVLGFVTIHVLAFINSLVHAGDGWTAVVPTGLALSAATFLVILLTLVFAARSERTLNWRTP